VLNYFPLKQKGKFPPTNFLICFVARYFRVAFCVAGGAFGCLCGVSEG